MPPLDTTLHLDMHRLSRQPNTLWRRLKAAIKAFIAPYPVYGLEWGDPDFVPPLQYVRDHFLLPYLKPDATVVEIGVGGGRWTRYMLGVKKLYAVDFHQELLDELKSNFNQPNMTFVKNNGNDFPGIPERSVDFLFSFGTFVHLDIDIIDRYIGNIKPLLKPESNVVIQYSDNTKPLCGYSFSANNPDIMRSMVQKHAYDILEEETKTIWHSSVIRFGLPK
jgi:ubiquinone/menaquinone biosynthesis C-methylase UbiE